MTATPPRADLRTLAAEALMAATLPRARPNDRAFAVADAVLAAVLPEHRRMVLAEAADELTLEIEWQREKYGDGSSKVATGRLIGMEDAQATLRRLAAAAPPAGPGSTEPAEPGCFMCEIAALVASRPLAYARWDGYPAAPGHALIVPRRHVASIFDATRDELAQMLDLLTVARAAIIAKHGEPDAWTIGINDGEAAGRTVPHLHLHLIPRHHGDVPDPRGGVRLAAPRGQFDGWLAGAGLSAPVPADNAPAVPEDTPHPFAELGRQAIESCQAFADALGKAYGPAFSSLAKAYGAPAVPEEADGQRATGSVDLEEIGARVDRASSDWRWAAGATYQDHGLRAAKQLVRDDVPALLAEVQRLRPGGFHEPDEPTDHVQAAFDAGPHGRTAPPRGQTRRLDVAAGLADEADGQRVEVQRLLAGAAMVLDELNGTHEMLLKTRTERDRLAAQVDRCRRVVEAAKALVAAIAGATEEDDWDEEPFPTRIHELAAAVDALPEAGTDQTEDGHGV